VETVASVLVHQLIPSSRATRRDERTAIDSFRYPASRDTV